MNLNSYYEQHSEHHVAQGKLSCKCFQQTGQRNGVYNDLKQEVLLKSSMGVTRLPISQYKKRTYRFYVVCLVFALLGKENRGWVSKGNTDNFKWKDTGTEPKQRQNTSQHNAASEFTKRENKKQK